MLTSAGKLVTPLCLCIIDDYSRLICHAQWFVHENTQCLVHAFVQAIQKIGLPRALASDNGSAMIAAEFTQGLERLGIAHNLSQSYCPYQNGKIESFWGNLEGRLMAMLEDDERLNLHRLNQLTQVWLAREYHMVENSETGQTPMSRHAHGKSVLRVSPDLKTLQAAFRRDQRRTVRQSDGTFSLAGGRFEVPQAYRTLKKIIVRYARWDLSQVHLVDPRTEECLSRLYPVDLVKNAEGRRRAIDRQLPLPLLERELTEPPLLSKMIEEFAATGLPTPYIPLTEDEEQS